MQSIWWPNSSRLLLKGIRADLGTGEVIVQDPELVQQLIRQYWGTVYGSKEVDEDKIAKVLQVYRNRHSDKFQFNDITLPF